MRPKADTSKQEDGTRSNSPHSSSFPSLFRSSSQSPYHNHADLVASEGFLILMLVGIKCWHGRKIDRKITELVLGQQKLDAKLGHDKSELEKIKQEIANAQKQRQPISKTRLNKEKSLADVRNQIDKFRSNMAMKQAELGT